MEAEGDIIKKTPFENGQDSTHTLLPPDRCIVLTLGLLFSVEMSLRIGPDTHPWIVTPCTYEAGVKGSFYMRLFAKPEDLSHIRFQEVPS